MVVAALRRSACALALLCVSSCAESEEPESYLDLPELDWEGERLRFASVDDPELCSQTLDYMDRFVVAAVEHLGVNHEIKVDYYHLTEPYRDYGIDCNGPPGACAVVGSVSSSVFTDTIPHEHELVHAASGQRSHSFFEEGMAVLFGWGTAEDEIAPASWGEVQAVIAASNASLANVDYPLAGHFTAFLVRRHGLARFLEFFAESTRGMDIGEVGLAFEQTYARPLDAVVEDYYRDFDACVPTAFREHLLQCDAEPIPICSPTAERFTVDLDVRCQGGRAIGPRNGEIFLSTTIEVPESGIYHISSSIDPSHVTISQCEPTGSCDESFAEFRTIGNWGGIPDLFPIELTAGVHVVTIYLPQSHDGGDTLQFVVENPCSPDPG